MRPKDAGTDRDILTALSEVRGTLTSTVTMAVRGKRNPTETAIMNRRLHRMETAGLVRRWDQGRPVSWCRTKAGTEALVAS